MSRCVRDSGLGWRAYPPWGYSTHTGRAPGQRSGESESCRLRRDEGFVVRSDDGQHRICLVCGEAAALPNALGGAWPHTPKLRAEAHTHF